MENVTFARRFWGCAAGNVGQGTVGGMTVLEVLYLTGYCLEWWLRKLRWRFVAKLCAWIGTYCPYGDFADAGVLHGDTMMTRGKFSHGKESYEIGGFC